MLIAHSQHCGRPLRDQQDAMLIAGRIIQARDQKPVREECRSPQLFAVADGVSVSPSPNLASRCVLAALRDAWVTRGSGMLVPAMIRDAHLRLCARYAKGRTLGTATTIVAAECSNDSLVVAGVGDSRAYLIDSDGNWRHLGRDDTFLNELIDSGELSASDTEAFRGAGIAQALMHCLIADFEETEFPVHYVKSAWAAGDRLLLCTDGVHEVLGEDCLRRTFDPSLDPERQIHVWRRAVLKAGAPDNFSMILIAHAPSSCEPA
jgi:serine/threonine protein phosphatase PrpC